MSEEIAVSLILVNGKGYNVNYLVQGREVDKSNHERKDLFQPGNYQFYWPGAISIFGGGINKGENPKQAFIREIKEELNLDMTDKFLEMDYRIYRWREDTPRILGEANEIFQGNVEGFLGFDLDGKIPNCVLGRDRKKFAGTNATYKDWLYNREIDYYFAADIGQPKLIDNEGAGAFWVPHYLARAMCMIPVDKLALLDDITKRIKSGQLEIKINRK